MTSNPIIRRELIGLLRKSQTPAVFLALAVALAVAVIAMWPDDATVTATAVGGSQARDLFRVTTYGILTALLLAAPAFPATAIVRERDDGTLALLLTSPLRPGAILLGKLSAVLAFVLILIAVSIPSVMACFVMGGIDPGQVGATFGILAVAAAEFALLALLVSSYARSTDSALRITYAVTLALALLVLLPHALLQGQNFGPLSDALAWVYCLSPVPAINQLTGQAGVGGMGYVLDFNAVGRYLATAAVIGGVAAVWLMARLNPKLLDRPRAAGRVTDDRAAGARLMRRIMFLWFFDPHRRAGPIRGWINPVLVKEFRSRTLGRAHWMMRLIGLCLIVSLALTLAAASWTAASPDKLGYLGGALVVFQMALIILITPSLSAALISAERESGAWQLLQMTPLKPRQIVIGKLLSVVSTVVLLLLATLPGYAVLIIVDQGFMPRVRAVLITLGLTALMALMLGAACSSLWRKTAVTTAAGYLLLILLCVGTLVVWLAEDALFGPEFVESTLMLNPLATGLSLMRVPGFDDYNLVPGNWRFMAIASVGLAAVLWLRTWWLRRPE